MRVVAMVSGGKDSCFNMMQVAAEGNNLRKYSVAEGF